MFEFIEDEKVREQAVAELNAQIEEVNKGVDNRISEAIAGLKTKNDELLGEKKKLQAIAERFKDIDDPEKAREALKLLEENEFAQLIKDGKIEEVIEKRISTATGAANEKIEQLEVALDLATQGQSKFQSLYNRKMIDDEIRKAAVHAGVRPEAIEDVLLRGATVFSLSEDGQVEARDSKGNLLKNKDKMVVTPSVWVDGLKETSPHYWPGSAGADLGGAHSANLPDQQRKLAEAAEGNNQSDYRKMRQKMKEATQ
ncbi:MAG: hypothetical protein ACWGQW_10105 [bacterium]